MFTVQSKREATGLKWDVAWSPECNMDLRCPDTLLLRLGTLARLGLCSAGAQLLLAPFWASGIDGFKFVLWQLINTCPLLCGLPWSILFYQTFHTAQNFSPRQNQSLPSLSSLNTQNIPLFFKKEIIYIIVDLKCFISFRYTAKWFSYI